MDTICLVIFYFLCDWNHSVPTYLFSLSFTSCCSGWTLYVLSFYISTDTWFTVCRLIYFSFPFHPAVLDGNYMSNIFYFLCYSDHSVSIYLFPLFYNSFCSGWTLNIQIFSISSATRITVCLFIYFPFPIIPAVPGGHYMSSYFLLPMLLGSQWVYLIIFPFLTYCCSRWTLYVQSFSISSATGITVCLLIYFPFPWLPAILDVLYKTSHFLFPLLLGSQCVYLFFSLSFTSCCYGWKLYIQSFSISAATRITECLFIYFPFPWLPAVLDGLYITSHFLFPLLHGLQCLYLFIFPFLDFLQLWMDTIYPVIFNFLCYLDCSVSTYLFPFPWLPAVLAGHHISRHFLFPLLLGSQSVYLFISLSLNFCWPGWTLYVQSFSITSATRFTECQLISFPFPLHPALLDGLYMSSHFLFPLLLGSQCVDLFIPPFL